MDAIQSWNAVVAAVGGTLLPALAFLVVSLFWFAQRRFEARIRNQHALQEKRLDKFGELWQVVAEICRPSTAEALTYGGLRTASQGISAWYQDNGLVLDSESRLWTLVLRERCARDLRALEPEGHGLRWKDEEWPRLWLIKTALRISLESAVSAPGQQALFHRTWPHQLKHLGPGWVLRIRYPSVQRLRKQLEVKFKIVDTLAADRSQPRTDDERRVLIDEVMRMFKCGEVPATNRPIGRPIG